MADIFDQTDERMEKEQVLRDKQRAIEAARPKQITEDCTDCGNRIPMARQAATGGTSKCAECKANEEHLGRHFR